jgi:hypothetical protein
LDGLIRWPRRRSAVTSREFGAKIFAANFETSANRSLIEATSRRPAAINVAKMFTRNFVRQLCKKNVG